MKVGSNVGTLKLGSTAVAAIKRGTDRVYDADVAAFQKASDAADVTGIMDLVDYLKGQSLWDYARFYPMKSSQNAGSGSTVYGLGGLTSNNMTLVNSPTWGSGGVTFDAASSQHGTVSDFSGDGTVLYWWRGSPVSSGVGVLLSQWNTAASQRGVQLFDSSGALYTARSSNGLAAEAYIDGATPTSDTCISVEYADGGSHVLWKNKLPQSLALSSGSVLTSRHNSLANIILMGQDASAVYESGTVVLAGFIETALTTTQRETITDLINAL